MIKILLVFTLLLVNVNAGKIFLGYEFDMDKNKIEGLKKVEDKESFPKPLEVYMDENNQKFIFLNNKLKMVNITYDKVDLRHNIESVLKNEFRLNEIKAKTKYGKQQIKNVGELLALVEKTKEEAYIFDSFVEVDLRFENISGIVIVFAYKNYMKRESLDCIKCEEIEGKKNIDFEVLDIYFTEDKK